MGRPQVPTLPTWGDPHTSTHLDKAPARVAALSQHPQHQGLHVRQADGALLAAQLYRSYRLQTEKEQAQARRLGIIHSARRLPAGVRHGLLSRPPCLAALLVIHS